jgi:predicted MFS family arabinose efflux permease
MRDTEREQDEKRLMKGQLLAFVLALMFILVAGSVAIYRYLRQHQTPQARTAWSLPETQVRGP